MKLSISLPDDDVEYLDAYVRDQQLGTRSAGVQKAVRMLRVTELSADYRSAWEEWEASGDAEDWERTANDGMAD